mmetsp:Transcript_62360/g.173928  ORF Transcript_62360/g.173928 Transcript_62360/m.173928 type:complete len:152 (-) Transcript_62360:144-599(-)
MYDYWRMMMQVINSSAYVQQNLVAELHCETTFRIASGFSKGAASNHFFNEHDLLCFLIDARTMKSDNARVSNTAEQPKLMSEVLHACSTVNRRRYLHNNECTMHFANNSGCKTTDAENEVGEQLKASAVKETFFRLAKLPKAPKCFFCRQD